MANVLPASCSSVYLELMFDQTYIASATGTLVKFHQKYFLITNRHVVTGRDSFGDLLDKVHASIPDRLNALLYGKGKDGRIRPLQVHFDLYDNDSNHVWSEHPNLLEKADLAVFKVNVETEDQPFAYDLEDREEFLIQPSDHISVIGFPFGRSAHGKCSPGQTVAIWSTGFLASDIDLDYDQSPVFLIDARTRKGQSGSPVVFHRNNGYVQFKDGSCALITGGRTQFLGVYSGRISADSDIGFVWKKHAIVEILSDLC